jgi:hypothetical protein
MDPFLYSINSSRLVIAFWWLMVEYPYARVELVGARMSATNRYGAPVSVHEASENRYFTARSSRTSAKGLQEGC